MIKESLRIIQWSQNVRLELVQWKLEEWVVDFSEFIKFVEKKKASADMEIFQWRPETLFQSRNKTQL